MPIFKGVPNVYGSLCATGLAGIKPALLAEFDFESSASLVAEITATRHLTRTVIARVGGTTNARRSGVKAADYGFRLHAKVDD